MFQLDFLRYKQPAQIFFDYLEEEPQNSQKVAVDQETYRKLAKFVPKLWQWRQKFNPAALFFQYHNNIRRRLLMDFTFPVGKGSPLTIVHARSNKEFIFLKKSMQPWSEIHCNKDLRKKDGFGSSNLYNSSIFSEVVINDLDILSEEGRALPYKIVYLIDDKKSLQGVCCFSFISSSKAYIDYLLTAPHNTKEYNQFMGTNLERREGVGIALIQEVIYIVLSHLHPAKKDQLCIELRSTSPALKFYKHIGFVSSDKADEDDLLSLKGSNLYKFLNKFGGRILCSSFATLKSIYPSPSSPASLPQIPSKSSSSSLAFCSCFIVD